MAQAKSGFVSHFRSGLIEILKNPELVLKGPEATADVIIQVLADINNESDHQINESLMTFQADGQYYSGISVKQGNFDSSEIVEMEREIEIAI